MNGKRLGGNYFLQHVLILDFALGSPDLTLIKRSVTSKIIHSQDTAIGARMWRFVLLLFLSSLLTKANAAEDLLLTEEAIELLQVDNVQRLEESLRLAETKLKQREQDVQTMKTELENSTRAHATQIQEMMSGHADELEKQERLAETSFREKEQQIQTTKAELENTKRAHATQIQQMRSRHAKELENQESTLQEKVEKSWTLVRFMMKVLKKSQGAAKARENLVVTQAAMLKQLKAEVAECKETIGESLKMVSNSQEAMRRQQKTIEDLKSVVVEESSLSAAYLEIKEANCDIPTYLEAIPKTLAAQEEEIVLLKQAVAGEDNVAKLLTAIGKAAVRGAGIVEAEEGNWEVLEKCQNVLKKQSSSLDLLRTLASERVTRNNSLRFTEDDQGHLVSAGFCQCIPDLPESSKLSTEVTISLIKDQAGWSTTWSQWNFENCHPVTREGSITRRKLKDLNAEYFEEDIEEKPRQCFEYNELNSPTRKSTASKGNFCDDSNSNSKTIKTSHDWKGAGWYRITGGAGTKLADSVVDKLHCGTYATGWMAGGHPTVAAGEVTRTVNFNWDGNSAKWTKSIKVINCNTHYVYYLEETPHCRLAYCTV